MTRPSIPDMGIFDAYPNSWSSAQISAFDTAYGQMVKGQFSWKDFVPPTSLPGATAKVVSLSLKALVHFGNKNTTAVDVATVHDMLKEGWTPNDIYGTYSYTKLKRPGSGLDEMQVFCVILTLERIVYGSNSGW